MIFFRFVIIFFLMLGLIQSVLAHSIESRYEAELRAICCSPDLKHCWNKIIKLSEVRLIINTIQKEGTIYPVSDNEHHLTQKFNTFWDPCTRTISINSSSHRAESDLITSILFELHNALVNKHLVYLDYQAAAGIIDPESYVQSVEKIEYQNSLNTSQLARKGVQKGIFPENTELRTYPTFEEHYSVQKAGGHSSYIAANYYNLSPLKQKRRGIRYLQPKEKL